MRRIRNFFKLTKNSDGFSLAEIMVAAGLLGMISLGVMQLTTNMQKGQKKFQQDAELNEFLTMLKAGLRNKTACERTFVGTDGLQPRVVFADLGANYTEADNTAVVNRIYSSRNDSLGNAMWLASSVNNENSYGQNTGGAFQITEIKIHTMEAPESMNDLVPAKVGIQILKGGSFDDNGTPANVADDTLIGSYGPRQIVKNFEITISVWDAADPALADSGAAAGELKSCYVNEDGYVEAACASLGGQITTTDGACKNLAIGKIGESYQASTLENESVNFEFLVDGNTRLKNNLEVGYDNGTMTDPDGAYNAPITANPLYGTQGLAFVEGGLFLGFDTAVPDAGSGDYQPGGMIAAGNLYVGSDKGGDSLSDLPDTVGNGDFTGSLFAGFPQGTNLTGTGSSIKGVAGGRAGQVVAATGVTIHNEGTIGYGLDIRDEGHGAGDPMLRVGDDTFFTDVDDANRLRLSGNQNETRAELQLGKPPLFSPPRPDSQTITGRNGAIGINKLNPSSAYSLDVDGNTRINGDTDISGSTTVGGDITVAGNGRIDGHLSLGIPTYTDAAPDDWAATVGWVRHRIAYTLAPDEATRNNIASDIMNNVFEEPTSALRVIQQNYCERLEIHSGYQYGPVSPAYSAGYYKYNSTGRWHEGKCKYYIRTCGTNNHCNNVYANNAMLSDGFVRAGTYVRALAQVFAGTYVQSGSYMLAGTQLRANGNVYANWNNSSSTNGVCVRYRGCYTRFHYRMCAYNEKVRGIVNGLVFCAKDIAPGVQ